MSSPVDKIRRASRKAQKLLGSSMLIDGREATAVASVERPEDGRYARTFVAPVEHLHAVSVVYEGHTYTVYDRIEKAGQAKLYAHR